MPIPTKGNGSPKLWEPQTPAMAAGLTDHIWTMEELLLFRAPPWRQPMPERQAAQLIVESIALNLSRRGKECAFDAEMKPIECKISYEEASEG